MRHGPFEHPRVVGIQETEEARILRSGFFSPSCLGSTLTKREVSIGVSVNDTSSETAMANEAVNPNDDMKRPTMPPMKPMGRNTASSENVVAITARPISFVPSIAASIGRHALLFHEAVNVFEHNNGVVDHDAHHQGQRQHGDLIQVESNGSHQREGGDDRRGNGQRRDQSGADVGEKREDDRRGQDASFDQMLFERMYRRLDEDGLIVDDLDVDVLGQRCCNSV